MDKKKETSDKSKAEGKKKTTDPQDHMEGPLSSIMQNIKDEAGENDKESKEEADEKKDKNK